MSAGVLLLAAVAALTVLAPGPAQAAPSKHSEGGFCTLWLEEVRRHNEENKHKDANKTNTNYEDYKYEMIPDCDAHGNFVSKQCHSFSEGDQWCQPEGGCYHYSEGETWCVCVDVMTGHMDENTLTQGEGLHCDEGASGPLEGPWCKGSQSGDHEASGSPDHRVPVKCHEWSEKTHYDNAHGKHEMVPECDEDGNYKPKQCHVFALDDEWCQPSGACFHFKEGEKWCACVDRESGMPDMASITKGGDDLHCEESGICHVWNEKIRHHNEYSKHEVVLDCDAHGNFVPKQCHVFIEDGEYCDPKEHCYHFYKGDKWCVCIHPTTGDMDKASITKGGDDLHCDQHGHMISESGICHVWNEKIRHHNEYSKHEVVLDCDAHGNFVPKQCHVFIEDGEYCDPKEHCYHFYKGDKWCVCIHPTTGDMDKASITKGGDDLHCDQHGHMISVDAGKPCCPEHWTHFGEHGHEHCFRFIDSKKTWVEAESYCRFEGGHLASIHCEETNHFLQGLTRGDTHDFPLTWVGGHNTIQACFWMWSDGQNFDYENWEKEESKNREHSCLRINSGCNSNQLKWSSGCCNETLPFVCAMEVECGHHW